MDKKEILKKLSMRQIDILGILVKSDKALMISEIAGICPEIPVATIAPTLSKMLDKGLISVEGFAKSGKVYSRKYIPSISKEEFDMIDYPKRNNPFVNYSAEKLVKSFIENKKNNDILAELDELEKAIQECRVELLNDENSI